jgi:aminoglycoside phosphotransferase (APT) family kinase protein
MDAHSVRNMFKQKLQLLARSLPPRFSAVISRVQSSLELVFSESYPPVLTHGDICEMNFLVNPDDGHLTGVIYWAEAEILPFWCDLWAWRTFWVHGYAWMALFR